MLRAKFGPDIVLASLGCLAICLAIPGSARAQEVLAEGDNGYRTGEQIQPTKPNPAAPLDNSGAGSKSESAKEGPVRMARFSYMKGDITWRGDDTTDWAPATVNLPIRQGTQVWVRKGGRANVQFDDGSELRLGNAALATLKVLYSDTQGEFTQITLKDGLATLYVRHDHSVYQIDTPFASVKANGAAQVRAGVDNGVELAVQRGRATVEGEQGKTILESGGYLYLADAKSAYSVQSAPTTDSWDRWNDEMNRPLERDSETARRLPSNINLVAGDLDSYGAWHEDSKYGAVWAPRVSTPDWRPYSVGNWTWADPYGWTWVSDEPWGWAPYHYGTWINEPYGWAWCPGPVNQYWSPGVVDFCYDGGFACWAPLAPWEVSYGGFFGCGFPGWSLCFSIGGCGCWYGGWNQCFCRPFDNNFCNRWGFGHDGFGHGGFGHDHFGHEGFGHGGGFGDRLGGSLAHGRQFVPFNARNAAGATRAPASAFGGHGGYSPVTGSAAANMFARGKAFSGPAAGRTPMSGPPSVQPTRESLSPTRSFATARPSNSAMQRSVYHASLPSSVSRSLPAGTEAARVATRSSNTEATAARSSLGSAGRSSEGMAGRQLAYSGGAKSIGGRDLAPAEAAQRARASLGLSGRGAGFGGGNAGSNSFRSGGYGGGYSYGGGRSYSGGMGQFHSYPGGAPGGPPSRAFPGGPGGYSGGGSYGGGRIGGNGSYGGGRIGGGSVGGGGRTGGGSVGGGGHAGGGGHGR